MPNLEYLEISGLASNIDQPLTAKSPNPPWHILAHACQRQFRRRTCKVRLWQATAFCQHRHQAGYAQLSRLKPSHVLNASSPPPIVLSPWSCQCGSRFGLFLLAAFWLGFFWGGRRAGSGSPAAQSKKRSQTTERKQGGNLENNKRQRFWHTKDYPILGYLRINCSNLNRKKHPFLPPFPLPPCSWCFNASWVTWHLTIRLNTMLQAEEFPASVSNLDSALGCVARCTKCGQLYDRPRKERTRVVTPTLANTFWPCLSMFGKKRQEMKQSFDEQKHGFCFGEERTKSATLCQWFRYCKSDGKQQEPAQSYTEKLPSQPMCGSSSQI